MNFTGHLWLPSCLTILQYFSLSVASTSTLASYTSSSLSRSIGYILRGFLLVEMEVSDVIECKKRCIVSANCVSLNIISITGRRFLCQMNSKRKESGVKKQFVKHAAGEYYGLKVSE